MNACCQNWFQLNIALQLLTFSFQLLTFDFWHAVHVFSAFSNQCMHSTVPLKANNEVMAGGDVDAIQDLEHLDEPMKTLLWPDGSIAGWVGRYVIMAHDRKTAKTQLEQMLLDPWPDLIISSHSHLSSSAHILKYVNPGRIPTDWNTGRATQDVWA